MRWPAGGGSVGARRSAWPRAGMVAMRRVWTRIAAIGSLRRRELEPDARDRGRRATRSRRTRTAARSTARSSRRCRTPASSTSARDIAASGSTATSSIRRRSATSPTCSAATASASSRCARSTGLVDLDADAVALHERMVNAYERSGRHRAGVLAPHRDRVAQRQGAAKRRGRRPRAACARSVAARDADLVMAALPDDAARAPAEKPRPSRPVVPRVAGDLVINGTWDEHGGPRHLARSRPTAPACRGWAAARDVTVADSTRDDARGARGQDAPQRQLPRSRSAARDRRDGRCAARWTSPCSARSSRCRSS